MGRAVEGDDAIHVTANTSLTGFAYLMPTIIVLAMIFVALFVIGCLSFELDVRVNQWSTNPTLQSNIMAALIICILITFYILGLDIAVLVMESKKRSAKLLSKRAVLCVQCYSSFPLHFWNFSFTRHFSYDSIYLHNKF